MTCISEIRGTVAGLTSTEVDLELNRVELGSVLEGPLQLGPVCGVHLLRSIALTRLEYSSSFQLLGALATCDALPGLGVEISGEAYWAWAIEYANLPAIVNKGTKLKLDTVTGVLELKEARNPLTVGGVVVAVGSAEPVSALQSNRLKTGGLKGCVGERGGSSFGRKDLVDVSSFNINLVRGIHTLDRNSVGFCCWLLACVRSSEGHLRSDRQQQYYW